MYLRHSKMYLVAKKELNIYDEITEIDEPDFFNLLSDIGNSMMNFAKEFKNEI